MTEAYKRNIVANLAGRFLAAALSILSVPWIVHLIGMESYGIVGFFASLQAVFGLLDLGLSATMTRETARRGHDPAQAQGVRDLVRTLEIAYWGIGGVIALATVAIAPLVGTRWLQLDSVSPDTVRNAVILMGLALACQWPISLYEGGIIGLQRQVAANVISLSTTLGRLLVSLSVLVWISPRIEAYLIAQAIGFGVQCLVTREVLWRSLLPSGERPRVRREAFREIWRFATGISVTTALGVALTQADKVVLTSVLPLKAFGYYMLANAVASGLSYISGPMFTALFPQFSQLVSAKDEDGLRESYHRGSQLLAVTVIPIGLVIAVFSQDVLKLWMHDADIAAVAASTVSVLTIGSMLHALYHVPYAVQLAYGWTRLSMIVNVVSVVVLVPLAYLLGTRYGMVGGAVVWLLLNIGYVCVAVPVMHTRLLKGDALTWFGADVGLPLAAAAASVAVWRMLAPADMSAVPAFVVLGGALASAVLAAGLAAPKVRRWGMARVQIAF